MGRHIIYSIYRIHFGNFGGFAVKILYSIFGLALTIISVTGINIWLAKRKIGDYLNNLWIGLVWGIPAALTLSAIAQVILNIPAMAVLWIILVAAIALAHTINDDARGRSCLQAICALLLSTLVSGHFIKFEWAALSPAAIGVNIFCLLAALMFLLMATRQSLKLVLGETLA